MPFSTGRICARHPELKGKRRNRNCPACQRERVRAKPSRDVQRRKVRKWRDANREQYLAGAKVRTQRARARLKAATVGDVSRQFRAFKRRAKRLGLTVDHIVPLAGCRVCGIRGLHEPTNWQMISGGENASKGNRCRACCR